MLTTISALTPFSISAGKKKKKKKKTFHFSLTKPALASDGLYLSLSLISLSLSSCPILHAPSLSSPLYQSETRFFETSHPPFFRKLVTPRGTSLINIAHTVVIYIEHSRRDSHTMDQPDLSITDT